MGGIDYRASRVFGFGLWAALFGGTYKDIEDKDGNVVRDGRATHGWFTLGVRGVLFP